MCEYVHTHTTPKALKTKYLMKVNSLISYVASALNQTSMPYYWQKTYRIFIITRVDYFDIVIVL